MEGCFLWVFERKFFHSFWKLFHGHKYTKYLSQSENKYRRTQIYNPKPLSWTSFSDKKVFGGVSFVRFSWPHKKCDRFDFLQAYKLWKTCILFFASQKSSKNVNVVFCKLKKSQKIRIELFFFLSLKNLRKHDLIFES